MRCKHCGKLIIHRFNHRYTRQDKRRKRMHEKTCPANPDREKISPGNSKLL